MGTRLEIRLDQDLLDRIDSTRGIASRSAWIRFALERAVETSSDGSVWLRPAVAETSHKPVSEEAPAAAPRATESRVRPAPPRSQPKTVHAASEAIKDGLAKSAPKSHRRKRAESAMSAALARQQALNKPKGI